MEVSKRVTEKNKLVRGLKKGVAKAAALTVVVAIALTLISCGGLSGTYSARGGYATFNGEKMDSIEFKSFGNAEIVSEGYVMVTTYKDASYKINGDRITLKAEWDYTGKWEGTYSYSKSGNSIYIDGVEYSK